MVGQHYLLPIEDYQFDLQSEKINSIARLVKLNIPTVPLPHVLLPGVYQFYRENKKLPQIVKQELRIFFDKLKKAGYPATVRPSIYAEIPGVEFIVANQVNLPTAEKMIQAIKDGYEKIFKEYQQSAEIEFAYLVQGFYTANKAGVIYSEDGTGHVHLEAVFGEHTWVLTRGEVDPDIYLINKETGEIEKKKIAVKEFSLESSETGLKKVKLQGAARTKPVFSDLEAKQLYQYALKMEKEYGSQEIECAALRTGELIFQSSRNSKVKKRAVTTTASNIPIFLRPVEGEMIAMNILKTDQDLSQKIVVTDNLDIDFITHIVYRFKPKGVILTKGSLTAHAVTILREAKVPSVLAQDLKINNHRFCQIKKNGEVNCYS